MKQIIRIIEGVSQAGAALSALFMVLIVGIIAVEIILRSIFNTSTLISDEYSAYFFVAVVLLGLAYTLKEDGHIRITLVTGMLHKRGKAVMEILSTGTAIMITSFALYHTIIMVYESWQLDMLADSISETPVYISQFFIPVGLFMLDLQLLSSLIKKISK